MDFYYNIFILVLIVSVEYITDIPNSDKSVLGNEYALFLFSVLLGNIVIGRLG